MASEKRLIDASKWEEFYHRLQQSLEVYDPYEDGYEDALNHVDDWMDAQPTVDAVEVVHGRWMLEREPDGKPYCFHCSVCDDDFHHIGINTAYNYCPNCGAHMDGERKDNE